MGYKEKNGYFVDFVVRFSNVNGTGSASANSMFASVEKKFNDKHSLNFTSIYAENSRGKSSPNTNEVNNLMGIKYNSYWGYQEFEWE